MLPAIFVVSALGALLVTPGIIRFACAHGLVDHPTGGRRVHTGPVPRLGGIAVFVSTLLGLGAAGVVGGLAGRELTPEAHRFFTAALLGGGILFAIGVVDDLRGVTPRVKLVGQAAAGCVFWAHGLRIESLVFGPELGARLAWLSLPLAVLWVTVVTNAFNLIDGLDGLASGIALVALCSTAAVALLLDRPEVLAVSLALLGALVGFLRYNYRPAKIFLGDSGSLFVGCMLAVLSVYGASSDATLILGVAPLFALAIPLIDATVAVLRRFLRCASVVEPDRRHIHHQLLARGLTHLRAVVTLHTVAVALAAFGMLLAFAPAGLLNVLLVGGGACAVVMLLWASGYLGYHEFAIALRSLGWVPRRLRRMIRDQIHAQDVAQVITAARSLAEINAILADNASNFGFLDMSVCPEQAGRGERPVLVEGGHRVLPSKLECPVAVADPRTDSLLVLRVWYHPDHAEPYGIERIAAVIAPVIRAQLEELRLAGQGPRRPARDAAGPRAAASGAAREPAV